MYEIHEASSLIQEEAHEDCEVIWGWVVDEKMKDEARVTVIATGFEHASQQYRSDAGPASRTIPKYKGEESLKELDVPAYRRRSVAESTAVESISEATTDEERPQTEEKTRSVGVTVRKLRASDLSEEREEVDQENSKTPAFLRKTMD